MIFNNININIKSYNECTILKFLNYIDKKIFIVRLKYFKISFVNYFYNILTFVSELVNQD